MDSRRRSRDAPDKNLILIPLIFLTVGIILTYLHPFLSTGFLGMVLSLAGILACFMSGMIYADLWSTSRRLRSLAKDRDNETDDSSQIFYDPFEDPEDLDEE
jgi:hypothetical protein